MTGDHWTTRPSRATRASGVVLATLASLLVVIPVAAAAEPLPGAALHDSFSRPDNWQIGSTETGQPWMLWGGTAVVSGNMAAASVSGYTLAVADSGIASGTVSLSVPVISDEFWMIFRASNNGNYWRFGRSSGGAYQLQQVTSWTLGSPAVTTLATVVPADGDRLECQLGSGITCSVDATPVVATADGFNRAATYAGFATAGGPGPPATRFDDITVEAAAPAPDLRVALATAADAVSVGAPVSWTATVSNDGDLTATGVELTAPLPGSVAGVTATSAGGTCAVAAQVSCALADLEPGASVVVVISGTAPSQPQTVSLSVSATANEADADPLNNGSTADITIEAAVPANAVVVDNFARADSWSMGAAPTGQTWEVWQGTARVAGGRALASEPGYTLAAIDTGTTTGSVTFTAPSISSDYWIIARASNAGNYWRFGRSADGPYELQQVRGWVFGSPVITVLGAVTPAPGDQLECRFLVGITCFVNGTAVASSADPFNGSARHAGFAAYAASGAPALRVDDFRAATPSPAPDLVVAVASSASSVVSGARMSWTTTVRNAGDRTATGATLSGTLAAGLSNVAATASSGSCALSGGSVSCSLGNLAPGATATVVVSATAPATPARFELSASAASGEDDGDRSTNSGAAGINVRVLAGPGAVTTDSFTRIDAPSLGTTEQGRPWQMLQGTMGVVGNQAARTGGPGLSIAAIDPGFSFGTYEVRVTQGAATGFYVIVRARDSSNYFRVGADSTGYYRMEKILNGQFSNLQFGAVRDNVRPADGDLIRITVRPDDGWFVTINGVHVLDGGDLDLLDEFGFGLATASPTVRFDDVSVTQAISSGITTTERFDHPEGSELQLQTPTSGTRFTWRSPFGYWLTRGGAAVLASPGYGMATLEVSSQLMRARVTARTRTGQAWLVFRHREDGSYFRFGRERGGTYTVDRITPTGAFAPVPGGVQIVTRLKANLNDRLDVRQSADGSVRCYINDVLVATFTDAVNNVGATAYGIAGTEDVTFDDFIVSPT